MDVGDLKRRIEAAREFTASQGDATFTLRVPTRHEGTLAAARAGFNGSGRDIVASVKLDRLLVEAAIAGWAGVRVRDLVPGSDDDSVQDFDPGLVPYLLDAQPDWAEALSAALMERTAQRHATEEAAAKN